MSEKCVICGEDRINETLLCSYCINAKLIPKGFWELVPREKRSKSCRNEIADGGIIYTPQNWHTHPAVIARREAVGWKRIEYPDKWEWAYPTHSKVIPGEMALTGEVCHKPAPPPEFVPFTKQDFLAASRACQSYGVMCVSDAQYSTLGFKYWGSSMILHSSGTPDNAIQLFDDNRDLLYTWTRPAPAEKPASMKKYMSQDVHPAINSDDIEVKDGGLCKMVHSYSDEYLERMKKMLPQLWKNCKQWAAEHGVKIEGEYAHVDAPPVYTYSARFEFRNSDIVEIPEPGDGWEKVTDYWCDEWQREHVVTTGTINGLGIVPSIWIGSSGRSQKNLDIAHMSGQIIFKEYESRMCDEAARCLSWTKWRKKPDEKPKPEPERYEKKFPLLGGDCPDCKKPLKECNCSQPEEEG